MDYVIKNRNNVYIKLNDNGTPTSCVESVKGIFEYSKAKNILNCLPKTLRKMNFQIEAIPEIKPKEMVTEKKVIQKEDYILSENITRWVDKFGVCADVFNEALQRERELVEELNKIDQEFLDILHIIEIEKSKDMYNGWKVYKRIRENREQRRQFKDELLIVESVLKEINPSWVQRNKVQKSIDGLLSRKYTFRIVEEVCEDENL